MGPGSPNTPPVDPARRQALIDALMGVPARVGSAFTNMAQQGLAANEAFLQGRGPDGEDLYARPLMPGADTGGRLGALASFVNSNMAMGGPAGSLGAGPSMARRGAQAANQAPMDEAHRIAQMNAARPVSEGGLGLPPNNTAADRAAAMGFDTPLYHGTRSKTPVTQFEVPPEVSYLREPGTIWATPKKSYAAQYGTMGADPGETGILVGRDQNHVLPLLVNTGPITDVSKARDYRKIRDAMVAAGGLRKYAMGQGNTTAINSLGEYMLFDPTKIRSRFAAFDPARRNEADLLAAYGPNPLAAALGAQPQE